jgi:hypothetical protein
LHPDGSETWVSPLGTVHQVAAAAYPVDGLSDAVPPEAAITDEPPDDPDPTSEWALPPEPDPSPELTAAEVDQILDAQLDAQIDATLDAVRWPAYIAAYQREMAGR